MAGEPRKISKLSIGITVYRMLNGLDLFSGIGGISIALNDWVRPIAYCEIDPYCQGILLSRQACNDIQQAPIWDDIKTLSMDKFTLDEKEKTRGFIDIIYGGFPCQDISVAGAGKGLAGERSGLFYEIVRLSREIKPRFIFLENVPAITTRGGRDVVREIAALGYDCRWCVISAASVGATHKRDRWFLVAHTKSEGLQGYRENSREKKEPESGNHGMQIPYTRCKYTRREDQSEWPPEESSGRCGFWEVEPPVGRVADGVPNRVERLRGLGNSVVPQQAKKAFKILMGLV
jgi:DNA (cytosine-5)-methyltransferase 1